MGFLMDLLFGFGASAGGKKSSGAKSGFFGGYENSIDGHDDYFGQVHNDAMMDDPAAIDEMRDEYGDDWEGEW